MRGRLKKLELSLLAILCALYTLFLADVISYCTATGRWYDFRAVIAIMALSPPLFTLPILMRLFPERQRLLRALYGAGTAFVLLLLSAALLTGLLAGSLSIEHAAGLTFMLAILASTLYALVAQPALPSAAAQRGAAWVSRQPTAEEIYERLLDAYLRAWGGPPERARERLEADIKKLVERGLSREDAVKMLYR